MNPITHFLASWSAADVLRLRGRDQTLATWCGVLPDLDGLGLLVDGANHALGRPESGFYGEYHHTVLHGLFAAVAIPLALSTLAANRLRVFAVGVLAVHIHYFCDLIGSRGPGADDIWPLHYLAPFSQRWTVQWAGQWPLNAWPNVVFSVLLMSFAFFRAVGSGYSPVGVVSSSADRIFVDTVRHRWRRIRRKMRSREA
jgi:LexA-binding, inner membrane-associated putative hydrolase